MDKQKDHFDKIYSYIVFTSLVVLAYVVAITFFPIPKENQRFVDIALAFLLGWISANGGYLTGGTPPIQRKAPETPGTTTADISATITTSPDQPSPNDQQLGA